MECETKYICQKVSILALLVDNFKAHASLQSNNFLFHDTKVAGESHNLGATFNCETYNDSQ